MSHLSGTGQTMAVSTDGGAKYIAITGITDFKGPTRKTARIDTTDCDSGGDEEGMSGNRSTNMSLTINYDPDCAGQEALREAVRTGVIYKYRYRQVVAIGSPETVFLATANGEDLSGKQGDKIGSTFDLQATGEVLDQVQSA